MFVLGSSVGDDVKWKSAIERALGTWESVVEWADYISFLSRVQKAIKNKHRCDGSQLPLAPEISEFLARCLEPSLPSGVHQMCVGVYETVFSILGPEKLASTVNIWLPGILPVVSWAAFNVKPIVVKLFSQYIIPAIAPQSVELRELYKPLFLAMLPSIEEESADCFADICELLATLKEKQSDDSHYWQSFYLAVLTTPECRLGALTWLSKVTPNTSEADLFIRSICAGLEDENVLVQRGFLDILAKLLPLDGAVLQSSSEDKPKVMLSSCRTIFRKDMSLNRRLRLWLLGPDPEGSSSTRLEYFEKNASEALIKVLLDNLASDLQGTCTIARGLMDRWEISAFLAPALLQPTLLLSKSRGCLDSSVTGFFDNIDANVVWATCIQLLDSHREDVVLFMVENFSIVDEDMIKKYIPLVIMYILTSEIASVQFKIVNLLLATLEYREIPVQPENVQSHEDIRSQVASFFEASCKVGEEEPETWPPAVVSWYLLKLTGDLFLQGRSAQPLNEVLSRFPRTPGFELVVPQTAELVDALSSATSDQVELFKFLKGQMTPLMIRSYVNKLVDDLVHSDCLGQLDKVGQLWELNSTLPEYVVPSALSRPLADTSRSPFERATLFTNLWTLSVDQTNVATMLTKPLLLFLDIYDESQTVFEAYFQSSILRTVTTPRALKLLIDKLDFESRGDIGVFTYVIEKFLVVISNREAKTVYITKFSTLMCTLLLEWFDKGILPLSAYESTLRLAELTVLDDRITDGRVWLRRFVDALTHSYIQGRRTEIPVPLMKFLAATAPNLENVQDIRLFAELSVPLLHTEVEFDAFQQLLVALSTTDPDVEENMLQAIIEKIKITDEEQNVLLHLFSAIEQILSVGVTYVGSLSDGNSGGSSGLLSGFQVESPEDRSRQEKLQAALNHSVQSSVKLGAGYWLRLQRKGHGKSTLHLTGRLKTRLRKLLSLCFSYRPKDTLRVVVESVGNLKDVVKLTHMFEGPRSSVTLEMLVAMADADPKMFEVAAAYIDSLETDVLSDVWPIMQHFLVSNTKLSPALLLRFLVDSVLPRLENLRLNNRKRILRELADTYAKLVVSPEIKDDLLVASAIRSIPVIIREPDRQAPVLSKLFSANFKSDSDLAAHSALLVATCETFNISGSAPVKVWVRYVSDFVFESQSAESLMPMNVSESVSLKPVIKTWVQCDKDRLREFLTKLSVYGSGTGVLFGWSGTQELANANLKRLAYILVSTSPTILAVNWSKLTNQLANMWDSNAAAVCLLLRACLLSQPTTTLAAFTAYRLQAVFTNALKSTAPLSGASADLLLEACKLLDLAIATGVQQFQVFQWLFISDNGDALRSQTGGILERLADSPCLPKVTVSEQLTVPTPRYRGKRRPILPMKATLYDVPLFLSQVTLTSYEEVYAMSTCDTDFCEQWLLADLFK